jgi:uncharacterized protein (TIGR02996 family)
MPDAVTTMLDAIALDPADDAAWLALADGLEDEGRPREAEVARLRERLRRMSRDDPQRPEDERRMQQLLAEGVTPIGPTLTLLWPPVRPPAHAMEFRLIPPGTFWVGSPPGEPGRAEDEALRRVTIRRGFWLAACPATIAQHSEFGRGGPADLHPCQVSTPDLAHAALCRHWGRRVRLPTEEEWEYACRAGTTSACHGGDLLSLPLVGWCSYGEHARGRRRTKPVRQFAPNAWGLYDMHGNVWEWTVRHRGGNDHILKGGAYDTLPTRCRSAARLEYRDGGDIIPGVRYLIELD